MTIRCIEDLAKFYGTTTNRLEHDVYKYTDCGAWIKWDKEKVLIGAIVEGSDAEFTCDPLYFPFETKNLDDQLEWLENVTNDAWNYANAEINPEEIMERIDLNNYHGYHTEDQTITELVEILEYTGHDVHVVYDDPSNMVPVGIMIDGEMAKTKSGLDISFGFYALPDVDSDDCICFHNPLFVRSNPEENKL